MHPWHDVDLGEKVPKELMAIVEVPAGSRAKFEVDKKTGLLKLKKILASTARYPTNYGFFPKTLGMDDAPLDLVLPSIEPIPSLTLVTVRPIGAIDVYYSNKGVETKILAVLAADPQFQEVKDTKDLAPHRLQEIQQFFETFKQDEELTIEVKKFWGRAKAYATITKAMENYKESPIAA